jgi:pimeloyl-ACP methyl ester carboxylesterase
MKLFKMLLFVVAGLCLLVSCEKSERLLNEDPAVGELKCGSGDNHHNGLDQDRYVTMRSTGLRVHYRVIGKGPVTMVFIPGWTNPLEIFTKQFDYFRYKAKCIYIDVPGQGLSDAPEGIQYTMGMMADAIYDVIRKEGIQKFVAVGFSMGPVPLGQFHLKHPGMITRLVNLDGGFYPWPVDPAEREAYASWLDDFCTGMESWGEEEKAAFASQLVTETSPQDLKDLIPYFLSFPSGLMANIFRNIMAEEVNQPVGWTFPILSIYSVPPASMEIEQLFFPNADIRVLEGGHVVQWEQADIVNEWIREFALERPGRKH